ncbi:hypothetical protein SNEBB_000303 [Seison nebaliae]|nr:hypothetical protein SNEBB_000303 [Seison nebaliae]
MKQNISIYCRLKPLLRSERTGPFEVNDDKSILSFYVPKEKSQGYINNKKEEYRFKFNNIFTEESTQDFIFDNVAKPVVDSALNGINGTIFAYGQTGSGKTFTITGGPEKYSDRGIIPRSISYIWDKLTDWKVQGQISTFDLRISYMEIYNENGYDLLDSRQNRIKRLEDLPKIILQEGDNGVTVLKNLSKNNVKSKEDALNLLFIGDTNRMIAETPMNQASTRSHCIFTLHILHRETSSALLKKSKLHLVDLAGSERVTKSRVAGQILKEATYINLSLHFLEQVIICLAEKNRVHVPYRNSMMTMMLKDSLGGNCLTSMIATCSINQLHIDESISTCNFSQRVALIKNEAMINEEADPKVIIQTLKQELSMLKQQMATSSDNNGKSALINRELTETDRQSIDKQIDIFITNDEQLPEICMEINYLKYVYHTFRQHILRMKHNQMNSEGNVQTQKILVPLSSYDNKDTAALKSIIEQRDTEISILIDLLKKEKEKSNSSVINSAPNSAPYQREKISSLGQFSVPLKTPPKFSHMENESDARLAAFEIFRVKHSAAKRLDDQRIKLKGLYVTAKNLGNEVHAIREKIMEWKRERELDDIKLNQIQNDPTVPEKDVNNFTDRMNEAHQNLVNEKEIYKTSLAQLREMKDIVDHETFLLDRIKLEIQRDFQVWWNEQEERQQTDNELQQKMRTDDELKIYNKKSIDYRGGGDASSSSIPPTHLQINNTSPMKTGDDETDKHIQAFLKARDRVKQTSIRSSADATNVERH